MKDINFAIIGYGFMGHEHVTMLKKIDGIKLIGVSDIDKNQLEDLQQGIKRYKNNEELFSDPDVDVVIISANNNQHCNLVIQAAQAGKDIICEKPVAMNLEELDKMIAVTDESGVKFTVHHQRRLDQDYRITKEIFDKKLLGDVYLLKNSLYGFNGNMHDWHVLVSEGGGMLFDWGVHLIDQILWMMPEAKIKSVFSDVRNVINKEVDDYFKILLIFDNNVTAEIELGTYLLTDKSHDKWFERHWLISGNKGTAYVDGFHPEGKIVRTTRLLSNVSGERTMTAAGPTRSFGPPAPGVLVTEELPDMNTQHRDYFENYVKAYHGQEEFLVKVSETRRVLHLMEVIRVSAKTGQSQRFE
ncbi:Gfo/Idh/MocA family protein [Brenneria tiliae]|uniref:Gfo/Idh/MocA family oxidoreductase n=1 Tax=Brenneria tiliae TaxID=2914984 RepID=A0ABT0MYX5_9GAMM|nr:Gfo/Idh/MocA family oxidoreductase [Brenneria tiliae]MCL2895058.1 Gfo/Idh/MocA family oxidoreductase [Brenneria tiliae]